MPNATFTWHGNKVLSAYEKVMRGRIRSGVKSIHDAASSIVKTQDIGRKVNARNDPRKIAAKGMGRGTFKGGLVGRVGFSKRFARIWERGGLVRSGWKEALAVPISPAAQMAASPRDFGNQIARVYRPGKPPLLIRARELGGKKNRRYAFEIMYILLERTIIPPHAFLRPGFDKAWPGIRSELTRPVPSYPLNPGARGVVVAQ